jgi:hypothetical protein
MSAAKPAKPTGKKRGRPAKKKPLENQSPAPQQAEETPMQNQNGSGPADSSDDFLASTAGIPDTIEQVGDPYAGGAPSEPEPAGEMNVTLLINETQLCKSIGITFGVLGRILAVKMGDPCMQLTQDEKNDLGEAWSPVMLYYLPRLLGGEGALWMGAAMATTAVFGGKLTQLDLKKSRANSKAVPLQESSASSGSATPENQPFSVQDFA